MTKVTLKDMDGEDDGAGKGDAMARSGLYSKLVTMMPWLGTAGSGCMTAVDFIDSKIPNIRGRPALREIIANLKPGITVSLVSLPLSISLAIAAASTPVQGIITAAWAGLTSAFFGGSHYNVVGPTGALSGILASYSIKYYPTNILPILAIMSGILCFLVWLFRIERFFVFIPSAVMHGFTVGVAVIIALNQLNFALGLQGLVRHELFYENVFESLDNLNKVNWLALIFFLVSFLSLYNLQRRFGKIPWSIVLAVVGIFVGWVQGAMNWSSQILTIQAQYGNLVLQLVQVSDVFTKGISSSLSVWMDLVQGAISIAIVTVLETLISAHIADRMTKTLFNQRREVFGASLANLASGITGGIPATAALARTALNIKSGASSRAAGIVNGCSIIILSTVLFDLFKFLPLPVVAAILVNVAVRMVDVPEIKLLYAMDKPMFLVALVAALVCIIEDPTAGIIWGALLAMVRVFMQMRAAHALLHVYRGTKARFTYLFETVDTKPVTLARASYTGEKIVMEDEELEDDNGMESDEEEEEEEEDEEAAAGTPGAGASLPNGKGKAKPHAQRASKLASATLVDYNAPSAPLDEQLPLVGIYTVPGYLTYISVQAHRDRVRALFVDKERCLPDVSVVVFGLQECYYADPDALDALGQLIGEVERAGKRVYMLGFHTRVRKALAKNHFFHHLTTFPDYAGALAHLRKENSAMGVGSDSGSGGGEALEATLVKKAPTAAAWDAEAAAGALPNGSDDAGKAPGHSANENPSMALSSPPASWIGGGATFDEPLPGPSTGKSEASESVWQ